MERNSIGSGFVWAPWSTWLRLGAIPQTLGWQHAPLYVYMLASFFWIFGTSFWTMKLMGIVFGSLLVIPMFYLTRTILGAEEALVASLIVFMYPLLILGSVVPGDKVFASFWILCAIYFLSLKVTVRNILLSGFLCGLTFLARFDSGAMLFVSVYIFYCLGASLRGETVKRLLFINSLFMATFLGTILPWLVHNYTAFGYFLAVTGIAARMLTNSEAFYISPLFFFLASGGFLVVSSLLAFSMPKIAGFTSNHFKSKRNFGILLVAVAAAVVSMTFFSRGFFAFTLSVIFTYPQLIYQSSPIIFVLAGIGIVRGSKKVGMTHPIYTLPVLTILFYSAFKDVGLNAQYTIPYLPLVIIFAVSAILDISSVLSGNAIIGGFVKRARSASRWRFVLTARHLTVGFLLGCVLLSFQPQYAIIVQAPKVQQGPFLSDNWDKAVNWILANTYENETIMARFPYVTFYTQRRAIALEPFNVMQLLTLINQAGVSYLVIDNVALSEASRDALVSSIYEGETKFPGFNMVYRVENPPILIFDVKKAPPQAIGWFDDSFTEGWVPDATLTFKSDGDLLEIAGGNNETSFLFAGTYFPEPIQLGDDPFVIMRYRLKDWTMSGYPPPAYLGLSITDSAGKDYFSDWVFPANDQDYDWHTMMWRPTPEVTDITKLALFIRIREAPAKLSVIIDYIAVSGSAPT